MSIMERLRKLMDARRELYAEREDVQKRLDALNEEIKRVARGEV